MRPVRPSILLTLLATLVPAGASAVEIPVDVGVGPAAYSITGPVANDQAWHFGLKLSLAAIIDHEMIVRNERKIPPRYRALARGVDEVRVTPSLLIPDALILSPKIRNTGLFGATWRPLAIGLPLTRGAVRFSVGAGLVLTYAFLYSDTLPTTHFLRPGLDVGAQVEIAFSRWFLTTVGWSSAFYIPQELGSFAITSADRAMWHFGQAFVRFQVRVPFEAKL